MKRRKFLKNLGIGTAATMIPVSVLSSTKPTKKSVASTITSFDARAALQNNPHFHILEKYARYEIGTQKRNKVWLTGSYDEGRDISEIQLNILFESNFRGFYHDIDSGETKPLDGVIVKNRYTINPDKNLNEQVNDAYDSFFHEVMMHHFGVERTRVFQKGMYDERLPKNIIKSK